MRQQGFTFVELLISVGLIAIFVPAIYRALSFSILESRQGEQFSVAWTLAREGMESVFSLKSHGGASWDWEYTPSNTPVGSFYQPAVSGGSWQLGSITSTPSVTTATFTRTVSIDEVRRCGIPAVTICSDLLAQVDKYTRKITVTVSWPDPGGTQTVSLMSYVTAH